MRSRKPISGSLKNSGLGLGLGSVATGKEEGVEDGSALDPSLDRHSTSNLQKQMQSGKLKI